MDQINSNNIQHHQTISNNIKQHQTTNSHLANEAPSAHGTMSLEDRAENCMAGIVLLEVFQMLAAEETKRRGLPRGSLWLAPETTRNLIHSAYGILVLSVSKPDQGNPFKHGEHRVTELPVERFFGRLRSQSPNAELSARSYWIASARDMLKSKRSLKAKKSCIQPLGTMPKLTPSEFYALSERAYRSALKLASFCADVTLESLHQQYIAWCQAQGFNEECPVLGDEDDLFEAKMEKAEKKDKSETESYLEHIQAEAEMMTKDLDNIDDLLDPTQQDDLKDVPDADVLRELFTAAPDKQEGEEIPKESPSKGVVQPGLAHTLHRALWCLAPHCPEAEIFDSIWRLVMYLRHWKQGSDRTWIKDARACRKKSAKLNWFQCLRMPFNIF